MPVAADSYSTKDSPRTARTGKWRYLERKLWLNPRSMQRSMEKISKNKKTIFVCVSMFAYFLFYCSCLCFYSLHVLERFFSFYKGVYFVMFPRLFKFLNIFLMPLCQVNVIGGTDRKGTVACGA